MAKIPDLTMPDFEAFDTGIRYTDVDTYLAGPWTKVQRCGVILYTSVNGQRLFCMGLDSETGEVTDFAGRADPRRDKTPIATALREFREETLDVFTRVNLEDIGDSLVIHDPDNLVIFIHCELDPAQVNRAYSEAHRRAMVRRQERMQEARSRSTLSACHWRRCSRLPEISEFVWLDATALAALINENPSDWVPPPSQRMFSRVRNFLRRCIKRDLTL